MPEWGLVVDKWDSDEWALFGVVAFSCLPAVVIVVDWVLLLLGVLHV